MSPPTIDEQIAALEHVIRMLHPYYARQVDNKTMTPAMAEQRIASLGAALKTLETVRRLEEMW